MLEKQRNTLIKKAFESAKIIAPGTELTALEIDDAAYTLNCMLQGWSNEGFRLFNMKTGYMPLLSKKNEYKLSTEAYSRFGEAKLLSIESVGGTNISITAAEGAAPLQSIVFLNNTYSEINTISSVDYNDDGKAVSFHLDKPVDINLGQNDVAFFGSFLTATTEVKKYSSNFSSIVLSNTPQMPAIGDSMYLNYDGAWYKVFVSGVDTLTNTVGFKPEFEGDGVISRPQVVYGNNVNIAFVNESNVISPRKINVSDVGFYPKEISIVSDNEGSDVISVQSVHGKSMLLSAPVPESVLNKISYSFVNGGKVYTSKELLKWSQIPQKILNYVLDWGSVTEIPASESISWGYVSDVVLGVKDFGTLTGSAKINGFAKTKGGIYVSVKTNDSCFVLFSNNYNDWSVVLEAKDAKLFKYEEKVYVYNVPDGLVRVDGIVPVTVFEGFLVKDIIDFSGTIYLISEDGDEGKFISYTKDFLVFSDTYSVNNVDFSNPVQYKGKMYVGKNKTLVTSNMKDFFDINVFSENRAVIGAVLQNFNTSEMCSYTTDGVYFTPMPEASMNVTKTFNFNGCSFISVYGVITKDGSVGSQVFSVNEFGDQWTPQIVISGKVFDIQESDKKITIVSDTEVQELDVIVDFKVSEAEVYLYGDSIGRPQEIMNVVKYGLKNGVQLSMEELALKDYSQLPHIKADGEPVSYCFFRDAKDGTMMVWGTPKKFGEYLKFTYVEPIALLDNAKSVPDIPDEYVGAVIDGLAAELAYEYALPTDKVQLLEAKAEASKQLALLHDNEMTSYTIEPNRRGL